MRLLFAMWWIAGLWGGFSCAQRTAEWLPVSVPSTQAKLRAIHGTSSTDVYIAGNQGLLWHFDGTSWQTLYTGTAVNLFVVYAYSQDEVWVAGEDIVLVGNAKDGFQPLVAVGASVGSPSKLRVLSPGRAILASSSSSYLVENAAPRRLVTPSTSSYSTVDDYVGSIDAFTVSKDNTVWMVDSSSVFTLAGARANKVDIGISRSWTDIDATDDDGLWFLVSGSEPMVVQYLNGASTAIPLSLKSSETLSEGFYSREEGLWYVGSKGLTVRWNGKSFDRLFEPTSLLLDWSWSDAEFWGVTPYDVWALTSSSSVKRRYAVKEDVNAP